MKREMHYNVLLLLDNTLMRANESRKGREKERKRKFIEKMLTFNSNFMFTSSRMGKEIHLNVDLTHWTFF